MSNTLHSSVSLQYIGMSPLESTSAFVATDCCTSMTTFDHHHHHHHNHQPHLPCGQSLCSISQCYSSGNTLADTHLSSLICPIPPPSSQPSLSDNQCHVSNMHFASYPPPTPPPPPPPHATPVHLQPVTSLFPSIAPAGHHLNLDQKSFFVDEHVSPQSQLNDYCTVSVIKKRKLDAHSPDSLPSKHFKDHLNSVTLAYTRSHPTTSDSTSGPPCVNSVDFDQEEASEEEIGERQSDYTNANPLFDPGFQTIRFQSFQSEAWAKSIDLRQQPM